VHATAEVAAPLVNPGNSDRQAKPGTIGRHCEKGAKPSVRTQVDQQADERGRVKTQRITVSDFVREPPLHCSKPRCAGEDNNCVFHP